MLGDIAARLLALSPISAQMADWSAWYTPCALTDRWTCSDFIARIREGMMRSSL
jgi:hypothetical protein